MFTLSLLAVVWFAVPVLCFAVLALASRSSWDHAAALATITYAEFTDRKMARAVDEARLFVTLAVRAERLQGDLVRGNAFRTKARQVLEQAWEVSARAAFLPFAVGSAIAAMHAAPASEANYFPAVTHCETRELVQGGGTVRTCSVLPAIRCTGEGDSRVCRSVK